MRSVIGVMVWLAAACLAAERPYMAIVEKVAGAVGFYTEDGRQVGHVPVGPFPHEAALSPDGRTLYVSVNGVLWMTEDATGMNRVSIVDVAGMRKTADIDLGRFHRPHGIALLPSGQLLATTERPFGLILVDPNERRVVRDFDVKGKSPHMVMPGADAKWAFVSNSDSDTVAAVNLSTGNTSLIAMAPHPQGGVLSRDGSRLYMTSTNGNAIVIIDTRDRKVIGSIPTGKGPARIALTPDGSTLVYNLQYEPAVGFADIGSGKQTAVVPVAGRPLSLTMTRDGRRAFAGLQEIDKVAVIAVKERKVERVLDLPKGSGPDPVIPLR
jgi:YVTN family beta-propeller protein